MPRYQIEMGGQKFEVEAPDDQSVSLAIKQIANQQPQQAAPSADPNSPTNNALQAGITGANQALTLGFGDELVAGALTPIEMGVRAYRGQDWSPGASYDAVLQDQRKQLGEAFDNHPIAANAGLIAGGLAGGKVLGPLGKGPTAILPQNASLLAKTTLAAGEGAGMGAIYGAGVGEGGAANRAKSAAENAAIGGAIGGVMPAVASGASAAYRNIADSLAQSSAAKNANVSAPTARMLADILSADGSLGPAGAANMARAGKEAMLADAGPNAIQVLDVAIQRGGPGSVAARQAIDARAARGTADMNTALDTALGAPQGVNATREGIRTGSADARQQAYNAAYNAPIDYASPAGKEIEQIIKTRVPGNVISTANNLMRMEGAQSKQILAHVADDGSVVFEQMPDVRQLDYITRALNQAAESGEGAGALGGQTTVGRAYQNLAWDLRSKAREAVPEYGAALDTAADPISRSKAVEFGSKVLSPSTTRDQVELAVKGMSQAEKDAAAQGVRSRLDDAVANVTRTIADGNMDAREGIKLLRDMSSRTNREKIAAIIGDQKAGALFDEVDRVATSFELRAGVAENSKTYARQAVSGRIEDITAPGPLGTLLQGKPLNAGQKLAQMMTNQTPEATTRRQGEIYSELADFLTRPSGQSIPNMQTLTNLGQSTARNLTKSQQLARLLNQGGFSGVLPATSLLGSGPQQSRER